MARWLIIGGGPHGIHIAVALLHKAEVPADAIRILDPEVALAAAWSRRAAAVAMSHLRSPSVHNVDASPWSLQEFAQGWTPTDDAPLFAAPYSRPSTALFAAHCQAVVARDGLDTMHVQGRASRLSSSAHGWTVHCEDERVLEAERVVLALGSGGTERVPAWAAPYMTAPTRWLQHVFDPTFDLDERPQMGRVAVIGGGISAAQLAVRLANLGRRVSLVTPHPLRRAQFDSSPKWLGPAKMRSFSREASVDARRTLIDRARRPGTLTRDVERALRGAMDRGRVRVIEGRVRGVMLLDGRYVLGLPKPVEVDAVALATGFEGVPGDALLSELCPERFPRAACRTPIVNAHLEWNDGLHVAGALAELQLGPVARNIAGALRAAERLVPIAQSDRTSQCA